MVKTVTKINTKTTITDPRAIQYAFKNSFNWSSKQSKNVVKRSKNKKFNPFFKQCLNIFKEEQQNGDEIWINIFKDAIVNKFPRHFKYDPETCILYYSYYKKKENIKLHSDHNIAIEQIIKFIQDNGCIHPEGDKNNDIRKSKKIDWSDIKSENTKMNLIECYAIYICKKHNLKRSCYTKIKSDLNLAIITEIIKPEHVKIKKNLIDIIDGVKWDPKSKRLKFESESSFKPKKNDRTYRTYYLGKSVSLEQIYNQDVNLKSKSETFITQFLKRSPVSD